MIKTAVKGVLAHKLRLALTALAIVMGVGFVAGTYIFTDTINARFETLFADVYAGVDATVRPESAEFGQEQGSLDATLLQTVKAVEGVESAEPSVGGMAQIIAPDGKPIGGMGPPTIGGSWVADQALNAFRIADGNGRAPSAPGEVAIDVGTAKTHGFTVGDDVQIQLARGAESFTIVGLTSFGTEDNLAGATISLFEMSEAQRLFGLEGRYSQIDVLATADVAPEELATRLQAAVPAGVESITGDQQGREEIDAFTEGLGFVSTALLAFAGVAVFVGAFIISNTFRIIVAQRTKELALLRAIGASRRQVTTMVMVEALIVGVVASAFGVAAGVVFSTLLKAGGNALGFGMPEGPLTIAPRTIAVAMTVGVVITLVSALQPARRAAKTPPVAALRDIAPGPVPLRRRVLAGLALTSLGVAGLAGGLIAENGSSLPLVAAGALAAFLGVSVLAPLFARPIVAVIGRPLPGVVGSLARGNTAREPRRTAATASALMIGVALVAFVSIFGASIKASTLDNMEGVFPADLHFRSSSFYMGVSPEALDRIAALAEMEAVSPILIGEARTGGEILNITAVDPSTIDAVYAPDSSVPISSVGSGMIVAADSLEEKGWAVGDEVPLEFASGDTVSLPIVGTVEGKDVGAYLVSVDTYAAHFQNEDAITALALLAPGVALEDGKAAAEAALADFPAVSVTTGSEQVAAANKSVDQMLALFSGLLGLAVIIAVVGIANTLALTTLERTREIGLLRAVGMGRRQVRRMVRWEAIMTSLFGAVLGIGLGTALGYAVILSLADEGLSTFAFPALQLVVCLAVAGVAGIVAAIGPARKAANMNVLRSIQFE